MKYSLPISVVMPCYNYGSYVSSAIESILKQTFSDFEFIIINDGSTDDSHEKIIRFKDERIKYVNLPQNVGNYAARNIGMKKATGKYICVMDADDIALPHRLSIQYQYLESHSNIGVLGSQGEFIDKRGVLNGKKVTKPVCSPQQLRTFFLVNNYTLHPSIMFRSLLLHKHKLFYNETYKYASDYDFVIKSANILSVKNIEDVLIKYRLHQQQISSQKYSQQTAFAQEIKIKLLKKFIARPTQKEIEIYIKLMDRSPQLNQNELESGLLLFNKILSINNKIKLYNRRSLFSLFDFLIYEAKNKNTSICL